MYHKSLIGTFTNGLSWDSINGVCKIEIIDATVTQYDGSDSAKSHNID